MKRIYAGLSALAIVACLFTMAPQNSGHALTAVKGNTTVATRLATTQQVSYYRATINFGDGLIGTGIQFGTLPKNSFIDDVKCEVVVAFNAGTTNVLTLGTTLANANEIVNASDVNELATGVTSVARGLGRSLTATADTGLWAKYTQTGTAATTGQAVCTIKFIPDNDL